MELIQVKCGEKCKFINIAPETNIREFIDSGNLIIV